MALGSSGKRLPDISSARRFGILCSDQSLAEEVQNSVLAILGTEPILLEEERLGTVEVLIVAENEPSAAYAAVNAIRGRGQDLPILIAAIDHLSAAAALAAGADGYLKMRARGQSVSLDAPSQTRVSASVSPSVHRPAHSAPVCDAGHRTNLNRPIPHAARGVPVGLTLREQALLAYLRSKPYVWVAAAELLDRVCGCPAQRDSTLVRVHMSSLRKKLGELAQYLESRRTYGYRWVGSPESGP